MKKTLLLGSIFLASVLVGCGKYGSLTEARKDMFKYLSEGKRYEYKTIVSEFRNTLKTKEAIAAERKRKWEDCLYQKKIGVYRYTCPLPSEYSINPEISGDVDVEGTKEMLARFCKQEKETKQFVCSDADKPDSNRVYEKGYSFSYDKNYRYFRY